MFQNVNNSFTPTHVFVRQSASTVVDRMSWAEPCYYASINVWNKMACPCLGKTHFCSRMSFSWPPRMKWSVLWTLCSSADWITMTTLHAHQSLVIRTLNTRDPYARTIVSRCSRSPSLTLYRLEHPVMCMNDYPLDIDIQISLRILRTALRVIKSVEMICACQYYVMANCREI